MKQTAIITGAGGNLGEATLKTFADKDYRIIATVSPGKKLGYNVKGDIETVEVDLTQESSVEEFIQSTVQKYKSIDVALLLVGGFDVGNISKTTGAQLKKMFMLNFETAFYSAKLIFEQMKKQSTGGRIVMIGSKPALNSREGKNAVAYSLSKSLVFKLAEMLNIEGASKNVTTHVVVPGTMDTPENRKAMPDATFDDWVKPEQVAETMLYLCNNKAIRESIVKVYNNS